jgi:integrase
MILMAQKLSDRLVKALPAPERGNRIVYDAEVKGFGARITAAGSIAFVLNYRRRSDGLERRYTIGSFPDWSVAAAREKAREFKRDIDGGGDPIGEHRAERAAPTVAGLSDRFLVEHVAKQRPHTQAEYRAIVRNDVLPALGRMKVSAVEFEHVERLHARITARAPILANRALAVVSKMFSLAIKWKLRVDNPAKGVERNREHQRRRYLKPDELARLTAALAADQNQDTADIFRLALLTGARRGELLAMRWDDLDLGGGTWSKPPSSTKQNKPHEVPLSAPARTLLATRLAKRDDASLWVFPRRDGKHRSDLKYVWKRVCSRAGIAGLRIHDLRHSFASGLVSGGASLPLVGSLLGHSTPGTTLRYAHLYRDVQREAVERLGAIISSEASAEVVPLKPRRRR